MLIGFCVTEFMLIGFCVKELLPIDVVLEGVEEDVFKAIDEVIGLDVEFVDDSESTLETAVSQLSSHEVALSIKDEEAVVPERVVRVDCTDVSSSVIAVSAEAIDVLREESSAFSAVVHTTVTTVILRISRDTLPDDGF